MIKSGLVHTFNAAVLGALLVGCGSGEPATDAQMVEGLSLADPQVSDTQAGDPQTSTETTVSQPTDSECADQYSLNASWADNCVLKRSGLYANTNYTLGVQRILWCLGVSDVSNSSGLAQFADGLFDDETEAAVASYQRQKLLQVHGAVAAETWGALREELVLVGAAAAEYSSFSIAGRRCEGQIQFYQRNSIPYDWKIAEEPNSPELQEFSVNQPFSAVN